MRLNCASDEQRDDRNEDDCQGEIGVHEPWFLAVGPALPGAP